MGISKCTLLEYSTSGSTRHVTVSNATLNKKGLRLHSEDDLNLATIRLWHAQYWAV